MVIGVTPFVADRKLTSLAIGYTNEEYIHEKVLPVVRVPGEGSLYVWRKYRPGESYRVPNTLTGRTGEVREVEMGFDEYEGLTKEYGLQAPIPNYDVRNAPGGYDPIATQGEFTMGMVKLDRERRVANLVFNPNTYLPSQTQTLSGSDQFSDPTSDPIAIIMNALDTMVVRANKMVIGQKAFSALSRHPGIVASFQARTGLTTVPGGIVPPSYISQLFFGMEVIVGSAWVDGSLPTTNDPLTATTQTRLWGPHVALIRTEPVTLPFTRTFGFTAYSKAVGMRYADPTIGLEGGTRIKVGEILEEKISAPEFGYYLQNAAA